MILNSHSGFGVQDDLNILKVGKFKMVMNILNGLNSLNLLRNSER